jgi:hypothetical protein
MSLFHSLRSSQWLARLALLWFVLTLGAAVASPVIHQQGEIEICSGMGMQKVLVNEDGTTTTSAVSGISCPLCLAVGTPPQTVQPLVATEHALGRLVASSPVAQAKTLTAAPPPARGPPQTC